jgi:DNA helicase IV
VPDGNDDDPAAGLRRGELDREQVYISALYARLDELRERAGGALRDVQGQVATGTHQSRSERDSMEAYYARRLGQLSAAEYGLCFGRLGMSDGARIYVGRIGLSDTEHEQLLIDWRAPAAQGFYRATPAEPHGVASRRHLRTKDRRVIGIDDDVFDLTALSADERGALNGEAALLASLTAHRTGRMGDIVATIQAEQDRIIRSELPGVLVVQGGPGTGKTVVALHRAAYLLYTYREQLASRGVLIVGPSPTFMRYIDQVLPSLGETDVLLYSVGDLFPGVNATAEDPPGVAAVKGDLRMIDVLEAAVRNRQRIPSAPWNLTVNKGTVHQEVLVLDPAVCRRARERAQASREPHNQARWIFVKDVLRSLTNQLIDKLGRDLVDEEDRAEITSDLRAEPEIRRALGVLWPAITPQRLLDELFASPDRLVDAADDLTAAEIALLFRPAPAPESRATHWTPADVPLLDEAAELLGSEENPALAKAAAQERDHELDYAQRVLDDMGLVFTDASDVVDQYAGGVVRRSVAERARDNRNWTFGHAIIDEAQELSPMAWRMVMRRVPGRSMTVVGDIAQSGAEASATSWAQVLDPYAKDRRRLEELTINYRTPAEIMEITTDVLAGIDPDLKPSIAVRSTGEAPWSVQIPASDAAAALAVVVAAEIKAVGDGRLAVIVPRTRMADLGRPLAEVPGVALADDPSALDGPAVVLTVAQSKGLEFDTVLVVEPQDILDASVNGARDLYVALTRATQRLGVVHTGELPAVLRNVGSRDG